MHAGNGTRLGVSMAAIVVAGTLGCSSPLKRTFDAPEAGAADLPAAPDSRDASLVPADVADGDVADRAGDTAWDTAHAPVDLAVEDRASAGGDSRLPDAPLGEEAGPADSGSLRLDSSVGDGAASGPEAIACTESFVRSAWSPSSLVTGGGPRMVTVADLDGDGKLDL